MKRHFEILDGLRGTASILVVTFHILEGILPFNNNPLRYAYLAVDFFFMLSGFVIGYAYDERLVGFTIRDFMQVRIIRLQPMVIISVVIGGLCYWFDPFVGMAQHVSGIRMALALAFGALLLPSPNMPNRLGQTHPLNGASWSLLQEYIANMVYVLLSLRIKHKALIAVVTISALALVATALKHGHLHGGWSWQTLWMAPVRVAFPFSAGLLIYRMKCKLRIPNTYTILSLVLLLLFAVPAFQPYGYYELFCVIAVFPLIVVIASSGYSAGRLGPLCRISGRLSYPLYLIHVPLVTVFNHWLKTTHLSIWWNAFLIIVFITFLIILSWFLLRFYDEPIRTWLVARTRRKKQLEFLQKI